MTTIDIRTQGVPSIRDATEYSLECEYKGKTYIAFVEITGQRLAFEGKKITEHIDKAKAQFKKLIEEGKIKPSDRLRFGFWAKGDFIINENMKGYVKIKGMVSKYAAGRLHIEIPKSYAHLFEQGDEIKIIKGNLKALFND